MNEMKSLYPRCLRDKRYASRVMVLAGLLFVLIFQRSFNQATGELSDVNKKLAHDIFRQLIEINTTSAKGTTAAAEAMASRLAAAGFTGDDLRVTGPDSLHKNLWVRYRGNGKLRPILFMCHLDVVEALPKDWSVDPFSFIEKDGYYYGRGTTDIKCEGADLVANLIRLKKEGYKPDRDIMVALTADEEGGNSNGVNWLLQNYRELMDAEYCINPDGGGGDLKQGKHLSLGIQTSEKVYISYELEAKNKGGHSSLPRKDNAIYSLAAGLIRISDYDFPVMFNETTKKIIEKSASTENGRLKEDMMAILQNPADHAAAERVAASSPYYNAMMRTTCVATLVNAGHAENALPQSARATVNCRMLPEDNPENIMSTLTNLISDTSISVTCIYSSFSAPTSPLNAAVMDAVEKIAASMWPGVNVSPVMATGATDGKYLRKAGIPVYGISGMFGDMNDIRAHGKDERIGIHEFYDGVEFMYRFMKAVTSPETK